MMHIAFRVDASPLIGSGHMMRCLTLADALKEAGHKITFVCRSLPEYLEARARDAGYSLTRLEYGSDGTGPGDLAHSHWLDTSQSVDAAATCEALGDAACDWIVVDHYALDARWEQRLRSSARRIMVIDDLADRKHDCDLLLDQNFREHYTGRYETITPDDCVQCLGPQYALLAKVYTEVRKTIRARRKLERLLIYFGGAAIDATVMALRSALSLKQSELRIDVAISPIAEPSAMLQQLVCAHRNVELHTGLDTLAHLMAKADLALGATGATSWERLCLGLPTIAVTIAFNQEEIAKDLQNAGLIHLLGPIDAIGEEDVSTALRAHTGPNSLHDWSARCLSRCDGLGTSRIADAMKTISA